MTSAWRKAGFVFLVHLAFVLLSCVPGIRGLDLQASLRVDDQKTYIKPAENLLTHGAYSRESQEPFIWEPYRLPGVPLLVFLSLILTGNVAFFLFFNVLMSGIAAFYMVQLMDSLGFKSQVINIAILLLAFLPNAAGLDGYVLTDSIFCYLHLIWVYFLIKGLSLNSKKDMGLSSLTLIAAQFFKPTLNLAILIILMVAVTIFWRKIHRPLKRNIAVLCVASLFVPFFFMVSNFIAHGTPTVSMIGQATIRNYIMVRYAQAGTGKSFEKQQSEFIAEDFADAKKVSTAKSDYGKLYQVHKHKNTLMFKQDPWGIAKVGAMEFFKQCFSPQDFLFLLFDKTNTQTFRTVGFVLNLFLSFFFVLGGLFLFRRRRYKYMLVVLLIYFFNLFLGSLGGYQGGRYKLPADILALPVIALGISSFLKRGKSTEDKIFWKEKAPLLEI